MYTSRYVATRDSVPGPCTAFTVSPRPDKRKRTDMNDEEEKAAKKVASNWTGPKCPYCGPSAKVVQDYTRGETTCTECAVMIYDLDTLFSY